MDIIDYENDISIVLETKNQHHNSGCGNNSNENNFLQDDIVYNFLSEEVTLGSDHCTSSPSMNNGISMFNHHNNESSSSSPMRVPNSSPSLYNQVESPEIVYDNLPCMVNLQQYQYQDILPFDQQQVQQDQQIINTAVTDTTFVVQQLETATAPVQQEEVLHMIDTNIDLTNTYMDTTGISEIVVTESPSSSITTSPSSPSTSNPYSPITTTSTTSTFIKDEDISGSSSGNNKKSKKRTIDSRVQNIVHPLTREELLKISGKEPVQVIDPPTHNQEDERNVKKQRRLIKNRESAQLSRMRKKIYIEDLEKTISDLTQDNSSLKEEVLYLQGLVKQLANQNQQQNNNNNNNSVIEINTSVNNNNNNNTQSNSNTTTKQQQSKNVKAAGVCLLLIFFSLGVFFQPPQSTQQQFNAIAPFDVSTAKTTHNILSMPENDSSSPILTSGQPPLPPGTFGSIPNVQQSSQSEKSLPTVLLNNENNNHHDINDINNNNKRALPDNSNYHHQNRKKIKINLATESTSTESAALLVPKSPQSVVEQQDHRHHQVLDDIEHVESTTNSGSYIVCSDSPRIVSSNITQTTENLLNSNSTNPITIGLLLPAESLNLHNVVNSIGGGERSILEISCQVSNIRVWNPLSVDVDQPTSSSSPIVAPSSSPIITNRF